jgi:DNA-directed RNA polymerase specialized sigma24 family protein
VTFLGRRADGAVLDATRAEMRRRPGVVAAVPERVALDPALARVDARLDAEAVLARLDARTADLLRRVYADGESLRAAGRAAGVGQTRAHQLVRAGIEAARAAEGR